MRWALALQPYNFRIVHRSGKSHKNADSLSRSVIGRAYICVGTQGLKKSPAAAIESLRSAALLDSGLVIELVIPFAPNRNPQHSSESDEAHFWLNGYVNKQNCRIWSEANPQVYVETPLHPEKLTVWCALWAGGILLQKR
ncbi:hypothetical protein TNCV_24501 [Trichonephila clavipes]|uniref:Uncharacterized protein n=1 Tax=Trichonephila clavipes TaxID=2585209 RepID=A0A8X6W1E8_TRICX|nr:hypothetical protein TNCV_24501 [Trichonephila clavipes]